MKEQRTAVLITVDVEDPFYPKEAYRIWGRIREKAWGIPKIVEILGRHRFTSVFFVDVYEKSLHGEQIMRDVLYYLKSSGQEVGLHTHPGVDVTKYGRGGMAGRTLKEQVEILAEGVAFIAETIGQMPMAHRAGSYKADIITLRALKEVGLKYDLSLFYKSPNCKIDTGNTIYNDIVLLHDIVEIPVTTIQVYLGKIPVLMKLDIEQDFSILTKGLMAMRDAGARVVVLFLHSWSFLPMYSSKRKVRQANAYKFELLCNFLASRPDEFYVSTLGDLAQLELDGTEKCFVTSFPTVRLSTLDSLRVIAQKGLTKTEYKLNQRRITAVKQRYGF